MAFTDEQKQRISKALNEKVAGIFKGCGLCGNNQWSLVDGLVTLPLSDNMNTIQLGGVIEKPFSWFFLLISPASRRAYSLLF